MYQIRGPDKIIFFFFSSYQRIPTVANDHCWWFQSHYYALVVRITHCSYSLIHPPSWLGITNTRDVIQEVTQWIRSTGNTPVKFDQCKRTCGQYEGLRGSRREGGRGVIAVPAVWVKRSEVKWEATLITGREGRQEIGSQMQKMQRKAWVLKLITSVSFIPPLETNWYKTALLQKDALMSNLKQHR